MTLSGKADIKTPKIPSAMQLMASGTMNVVAKIFDESSKEVGCFKAAVNLK